MPVPYFGGRSVVRNMKGRLARRAARTFLRSADRWSQAQAARLARPFYRGTGVVTRRRTYGIKRTVMRMKETHFVDYNWGKHELYHNAYNNFIGRLNDPACLPTQGDGDDNRTGNDIYARGIQCKMMFGVKSDRHNCTFRVVVFKTTKGYNVSSYSQVFDSQTGNVMLDGVDKDRVTVIMDRKYAQKVDVNQHNVDKEITFFRTFYIPHKVQYKFYDDGVQDNSYPYDIHFCVMCYDAYGSLVTDNIAYMQMWSRFYFKDK